MHASLALLATSFDWSYFVHNGPVRIIAIAGVLVTLIQMLKMRFPGLGGWYAIALNVTLSVAGVLAITTPANMLTIDTLGNVLTAAAIAAGIHGTAKLMSPPNYQGLPSGTGNGAAKALMLVLVLGLCGLMTGCTSFERTTFQTLSASKAVIDQAQIDYQAKAIPQTACSYALINDAKAAQTASVAAMVVYEEDKAAGASLTAQTAVVTGTIAQIPVLLVDLRGLYGSPAVCKLP
jgi:hypothetical protein